MSQASFLERLLPDILTVLSAQLSPMDLRRLQRCSRNYHVLFSDPEVWVPHLIRKSAKRNLWRKSVPTQSVALLMAQQWRYATKWGGELRFTCGPDGKARFEFGGDYTEYIFSCDSLRGTVKGRFRPPKIDDPVFRFKAAPDRVFELRLRATEGTFAVYDDTEDSTDKYPDLKGTIVLAFTASGQLSVRRADWDASTWWGDSLCKEWVLQAL